MRNMMRKLSTKTFGIAAVASLAFMPLLQCGGGGGSVANSTWTLVQPIGSTYCHGQRTAQGHLFTTNWTVYCGSGGSFDAGDQVCTTASTPPSRVGAC